MLTKEEIRVGGWYYDTETREVSKIESISGDFIRLVDTATGAPTYLCSKDVLYRRFFSTFRCSNSPDLYPPTQMLDAALNCYVFVNRFTLNGQLYHNVLVNGTLGIIDHTKVRELILNEGK